MDKQRLQELFLGVGALVGSYTSFEMLLSAGGRIYQGKLALESIGKPMPLLVIEPLAGIAIVSCALSILGLLASYRLWTRAALYRLAFLIACLSLSIFLISVPGQFRIFDKLANVTATVTAASYFLSAMVLALEGITTVLGLESDIRRFVRWEGTILFSRGC